MAVMLNFPFAVLPHEIEKKGHPPVPNPTLEVQFEQLFFFFLPTMPILAFELIFPPQLALKPSLLQFRCKGASEPISDFHVSRPSDVLRYFPSAISENRESACFLMTMNLSCWSIFIPRQIWEKDVFQYVGSFVSCSSKPVCPPVGLNSL